MPEVLQQELGSISSFSAPAQATSRGIALPTSVSCPAAGSQLCAWGGHISCVQCQQGCSLPKGLLEMVFALLLLWKRLLKERHLCCLRVWQGAQGVLQSLSSLNVAPGCGACRGVQPFGLFQFECLGRILGSPEHPPVKTGHCWGISHGPPKRNYLGLERIHFWNPAPGCHIWNLGVKISALGYTKQWCGDHWAELFLFQLSKCLLHTSSCTSGPKQLEEDRAMPQLRAAALCTSLRKQRLVQSRGRLCWAPEGVSIPHIPAVDAADQKYNYVWPMYCWTQPIGFPGSYSSFKSVQLA